MSYGYNTAQSYLLKFAEIFAKVEMRSVTVAVMQVPCCQSLPIVVQKALEMTGKHIPIEKVVISLEGEIVQRKAMVA